MEMYASFTKDIKKKPLKHHLDAKVHNEDAISHILSAYLQTEFLSKPPDMRFHNKPKLKWLFIYQQ
jgi:hypothetical protein